ncbi:MAG: DNA polymerase I [Armatimonadetes bacterium]|nr:DNA polymerase I [Armatimonadota bacterium]
MPDHRLILVDGYSLLYRAFYSTRFLSTTDGRPTNALYGFTSMLFQLIEQQKPDAVLVALDAPGKTFRHADYAEYKGTRREMPPEMLAQMPVARDLIAALGIPQIELVGYEADDIIGTIACQAEKNGYYTTIITGDLDSLQLVDDCISVVTPKVGVSDVVTYNIEAVKQRYGFGPEFVPDYKSLAGDSSDNIKGVPGVGEKTASTLIQRFGPVEVMLERIEELEEKFRKKIEPERDNIPLMKKLATIVRDAPIEWDFAPYKLTQEGFQKAEAMMVWLEFRAIQKRLAKVLGPYVEGMAASAAVEVQAERLEVTLRGHFRSVEEAQRALEEKNYGAYIAPPAQASFFDDPVEQVYLSVGKDVWTTPVSVFEHLFADQPGRAMLHDSKQAFKRIKPTQTPAAFDAMLAGYVLQSGRSEYSLPALAQGYLEIVAPVKPEELAASVSLLEPVMRERLEKENQFKVYSEVELKLVPILAEMEGFGIKVSRDFLTDFSKSLEVEIKKLEEKVHELAGEKFTIGSPKQLGQILFEKLEIPGAKKTKTGYATGAEILQELAAEYPIVQEVLNWRELTKLKSTYSDALPAAIGDDGRIHTSYNQTVAATGRLSSNEPNLQNIPIRTELGRQIRRAFVAEEGYRLASFDYSQIELRLLAHLCKDEALCDAFHKRVDVHTVTAALMFHVEQDQVTKDQRRLAKLLNYAVLYGVTDYGLAAQLGAGFGLAESRELIKQYFERFPSVKQFTDSVIEDARSKGFTTTLWGRRRYFPDIHAANRNERLYAERQAMNAPIQGAAADMIKLAMIDVRRELGAVATRMLLQVHDELVFELAKGEDDQVEPIRRLMENAMPLEVPTEVDAKIGPNWNEMAVV